MSIGSSGSGSRVRAGLVACAAAVALIIAACDTTEESPSLNDLNVPTNPTPGVHLDAILNDVEDVRTLLAEHSTTFSADAIADASFDNGQLTVVVTDEIDGLEDAERFCQQLSEAIAAQDVSIEVRDASGAALAQCRFDA